MSSASNFIDKSEAALNLISKVKEMEKVASDSLYAIRCMYENYKKRRENIVEKRFTLLKSIEKTEDNTGWHGYLHFLKKGEQGVVKDFFYDLKGNEFVYLVFDNDSWINREGQKIMTEPDRKSYFCFLLSDIEI